jgi:hypothetical protein
MTTNVTIDPKYTNACDAWRVVLPYPTRAQIFQAGIQKALVAPLTLVAVSSNTQIEDQQVKNNDQILVLQYDLNDDPAGGGTPICASFDGNPTFPIRIFLSSTPKPRGVLRAIVDGPSLPLRWITQ